MLLNENVMIEMNYKEIRKFKKNKIGRVYLEDEEDEKDRSRPPPDERRLLFP